MLRIINRYRTDDANGAAIINRNSDPLSVPPPGGYHPAFDRTRVGLNPWNLGPPDGRIRIDDVSNIIQQYRNDCA